MFLTEEDIRTLEIFAYHHILVGYYDEALSVYELLSQMEPDQLKWRLARGLCLMKQGRHEAAVEMIKGIDRAQLLGEQRSFLYQLNLYIDHQPLSSTH